MIRAGLALSVLAIALVLMPADEAQQAAVHWDSQTVEGGFLEIIEMRHVPQVPIEELRVSVDGQTVEAAWMDTNGLLNEGDRVMFVLDEMDLPRTLELHHAGEVVLHFTFGSGAGTPV